MLNKFFITSVINRFRVQSAKIDRRKVQISLWKSLKPVSVTSVFRKQFLLLVKIKSITDLLVSVKHVGEVNWSSQIGQAKLVKLNKSQNSSSLSNLIPLLVTSILRSLIAMKFS